MQTTSIEFPCMRPGYWPSGHRANWTEPDLHRLARNFSRREFVAPLKLGHDMLALGELPVDGQPAFGRIRHLWVEGTGPAAALWCRADRVPVVLAESIRNGRYLSASVEVRDVASDGAPLTERSQVTGVALLGAAQAAIDLPDLSEVVRLAAPRDDAWNNVAAAPVPPATMAEREPVELRGMRAHLTRLSDQVLQMSEHTATLLGQTQEHVRDAFSAALFARIGELNLNPEEPEVRARVAAELRQRPEFQGIDEATVREVVTRVSTDDGLAAARAKLGELQRDVSRLENQRAARAHDGVVDVSGAGTPQLAVGETQPDPVDQHVHQVWYDPETGDGMTAPAGEPPHAHDLRNGEVQPVSTPDGNRSTHPGPVGPEQGNGVAALIGGKNKNMPLAGSMPPGVRLPLHETYAERSRRIIVEAEHAGTLPLVGPQVAEAEALGDRVELGERGRYDELRRIAGKYQLDLRHGRDREKAERLLWDGLASTVRTSRTLDELLRCVERTERLNFAEHQHERVAALHLARRLRPDLCGGDYGAAERRAATVDARIDARETEVTSLPSWWPRGLPSGPPGSAEHEAAQIRRLNDLVADELKRLGYPHGAEYEVRQRVLAQNPHLKPNHGVRRPSLALGDS